jgi:aminocarboxymuconate-semialdehyde decarboxylase
MLSYVIDLVGSKKVSLGTDYPFPLGDLEIGKFIEEMGLEEEVVKDIFHRSALEWLGMSESDFQ